MAKKIMRRIYEDNGRWLMETTNTRGSVSAVYCESKEAAERLLNLATTYYRKSVLFSLNEMECIGKVTNTGLLYKNGNDQPPVEVLYIRYKSATYVCARENCEIV